MYLSSKICYPKQNYPLRTWTSIFISKTDCATRHRLRLMKKVLQLSTKRFRPLRILNLHTLLAKLTGLSKQKMTQRQAVVPRQIRHSRREAKPGRINAHSRRKMNTKIVGRKKRRATSVSAKGTYHLIAHQKRLLTAFNASLEVPALIKILDIRLQNKQVGSKIYWSIHYRRKSP